ncbi:MAG TPA: heme-binding beta-barrel domain-containing protein [Methylocystis sp.]|nr:heme-binding beta-barrel domain-containing protein [Methylocystis sp.]
MTDNVYLGYGRDIYTEPGNVDPDTLGNLGPLRPMAGVWRGAKGLDVNPKAAGPLRQAYVERLELQPIDPQTNGPQLFYGLRYHQHIVKPGEVETYHDQIGYWLWEPATGLIIQTLAIPRGQTAMAVGKAAANAREFELIASRGVTTNGICSNPFLEQAFRTDEYRITITIHDDGTWSYDETTTLMIKGEKRFEHTDGNRLVKIGEPTPNPLAAAEMRVPSRALDA